MGSNHKIYLSLNKEVEKITEKFEDQNTTNDQKIKVLLQSIQALEAEKDAFSTVMQKKTRHLEDLQYEV